MTNFESIRSYRDDEVKEVLDGLLEDPGFLKMITQYRYPRMYKRLGEKSYKLTQVELKKKVRHVKTVAQFQEQVASMLIRTIRRTASEFSVSGVENLNRNSAYLFISNHRDIVLDPALVNLSVYQNELQIPHLAIGDNLLTHQFVSDLMRLNKSFIVKRSSGSPREKYEDYSTLSEYIGSLLKGGRSVWIAQREGRAKDGNDVTDTAIIKMIYIGGKKEGRYFSDYLDSLNIVPVAISYEYDPCDYVKAQELYIRKNNEQYRKEKNEDMLSIARGIMGYKGHIHVSFGQVLRGYQQVSEVASEIDRQIHKMYHLYPSNIFAWQELYGKNIPSSMSFFNEILSNVNVDEKNKEFQARWEGYSEDVKKIIYGIYSQPINNRFKIN